MPSVDRSGRSGGRKDDSGSRHLHRTEARSAALQTRPSTEHRGITRGVAQLGCHRRSVHGGPYVVEGGTDYGPLEVSLLAVVHFIRSKRAPVIPIFIFLVLGLEPNNIPLYSEPNARTSRTMTRREQHLSIRSVASGIRDREHEHEPFRFGELKLPCRADHAAPSNLAISFSHPKPPLTLTLPVVTNHGTDVHRWMRHDQVREAEGTEGHLGRAWRHRE